MKIITRVQSRAYYRNKKAIIDTFLEVLSKETMFKNFENFKNIVAEPFLSNFTGLQSSISDLSTNRLHSKLVAFLLNS